MENSRMAKEGGELVRAADFVTHPLFTLRTIIDTGRKIFPRTAGGKIR